MTSSFESLSTELLFEIFGYLSPFDLFRIFINLNSRLNSIVHSYPLRLDFRQISRSKFDFICRHLQPEQVISLFFDDENMPDQVQLFIKNFLHVKHQFTRLRSVTFSIKRRTILPALPFSISSLSFKWSLSDWDLVAQTLVRHAKLLTHMKVDVNHQLESIDIPFPALTHLNIGRCSVVDLHRIIQRFGSSITHLNVSVDNYQQNKKNLLPNFEQLSHCLTHLTITLSDGRKHSLSEECFCFVRCYRNSRVI